MSKIIKYLTKDTVLPMTRALSHETECKAER
jgi:hypothetical protein